MGEEKSLYEQLRWQNIINLMEPLIKSGQYIVRMTDAKLVAKTTQIATNTPWIFNGPGYGYDCHYWQRVVFETLSRRISGRFVPRSCHQCFKVVVKPRTLEQLFALLDIQRKSKLHSKCGIELRESVPGLYGGYFYNRGLAAGLVCYNKVYGLLEADPIMKPLLDEKDGEDKTTRIVLKRGCTEFEHGVGPSDRWVITPEQNALEDLLESFMVLDNDNLTQQDHLLWDVQQRWIEWAWQHGDPTYSKYTNEKPIYPPYITYHPDMYGNIKKNNLTKENKENGSV